CGFVVFVLVVQVADLIKSMFQSSPFVPGVTVFFVLFAPHSSNHNGSTPLVLAKRRGVNKDAIRLLEGLEEQEVKGFNRGAHSKLETMQMADSER
ncbi:hypothetical protein XENOCAPTIV_006109, partial [Xenoophorus captivus]